MKVMNKRILILVLSSLFALAACGKSSNEAKTDSSNSNIVAAPAVQTTKTDTIETAKSEGIALLRSSYNRCIEQANGVDAEVLSCIAQETEYQDRKLNQIYQSLIKQLPEAQKKKLVSTQKAWLSYAQQDSDFDLVVNGEGTAAQAMAKESYLNKLAERVRSLAGTLDFLKVS